MAKEPHQKTNAELAQDLSTRPDSLVHLTARAEMARRAAVQDQWRSWIMLASVVIAALAAAASACSAYFAGALIRSLVHPALSCPSVSAISDA